MSDGTQTMKGRGTVISPSGEQVAVQYEVTIHQHAIEGVPSLPSYTGTVKPVCFQDDHNLTLKMEDGRTLTFFFLDLISGSINVNWFAG